MAPSFNLVDEPWIPCVTRQGRTEPLSLRDALLRAHEYVEIRGESPPITAALYRLLLAILHRNFGPADLLAWKAVWRTGRFEAAPLRDYLSQWRSRFDLCDPIHPFYQLPSLSDAEPGSVWRLAFVQGNNSTLFDHRTEHDSKAVPAAVAARFLLAYQAFGLGGGVAKPFNFCHAPLAKQRGYVALVTGDSLFETLWLNAAIYSDRSPFPRSPDDAPAWENDEFGKPVRSGTPVRGYLHYLTWQSRRIQLVHDSMNGLSFKEAVIAQGHAFPDDFGPHEPMFAYIRVKDRGFVPRPLSEGRSVWRDSHALLQSASEESKPPASIERAAVLRLDGTLPSDRVLGLMIVGLCSDRAKISLWRHEGLPLPVALLADEDRLTTVARSVDAAEAAAKALGRSLWRLEVNILAPDGQRKPDKDNVRNLVESLGHEARYWSRLEHPFRSLVLDLGRADGDDQRLAAEKSWAERVCRTARQVFHQIVTAMEATPRVLRAVHRQAGAEHVLNSELRSITSIYKETAHEHA